jgi:hypothetical protein
MAHRANSYIPPHHAMKRRPELRLALGKCTPATRPPLRNGPQNFPQEIRRRQTNSPSPFSFSVTVATPPPVLLAHGGGHADRRVRPVRGLPSKLVEWMDGERGKGRPHAVSLLDLLNLPSPPLLPILYRLPPSAASSRRSATRGPPSTTPSSSGGMTGGMMRPSNTRARSTPSPRSAWSAPARASLSRPSRTSSSSRRPSKSPSSGCVGVE